METVKNEDPEEEEEEEEESEEDNEDEKAEDPVEDEKSSTGNVLDVPVAAPQLTTPTENLDDETVSELPPDIPDHSRSSSPTSPTKMMSGLDLNGIKGIVSSDLTKVRASQQRKYHSKRGARRAGRPQGSKSKQDTRVKLDQSGVWE